MNIAKLFVIAGMAGGALAVSGCATVERRTVQATTNTYTAMLRGSEIVQGAGDPDGRAQAQLSVSDTLDKICYKVHDVSNIGSITRVAISRGRKGAVGPVLLTLRPNNDGVYDNCLTRGEQTSDTLKDWAEGYYITIFTADYPGGAVRGNFYDSKG